MPNGLPPNWRPFFQQSIEELETIVAENQGNTPLLQMVLQELEQRSTPRARLLRSHLETQLTYRGTPTRGSLPASRGQLSSGSTQGNREVQPRTSPSGPIRTPWPSRAPSQASPSSAREPWPASSRNEVSHSGSSASWKFPEWIKVVAGVGVLLILYRAVFG